MGNRTNYCQPFKRDMATSMFAERRKAKKLKQVLLIMLANVLFLDILLAHGLTGFQYIIFDPDFEGFPATGTAERSLEDRLLD